MTMTQAHTPGRSPAAQALIDKARELEAERDALREQVASLTAQCEALQRAQIQAPHEPAATDAPQSQEAELTRLRMRIEELVRQQEIAGQSGVEGVDAALGATLLEKLHAMEQAYESDGERLSALRRARESFERTLGNPGANGTPQAARGGAGHAEAPTESTPGGREPARRAASTARAGRGADTRGADTQSAEPVPTGIVLEPGEELTVVQVEDHAPLREALQAVVDGCACARYAALDDIALDATGSPHLLAVNLLARETDPLAAICDARWRQREPHTFIYFAAGARGVIAGLAEFFPYPLEPNDCVTRLLERRGGTQRLLMVSDKIDSMNEIRAVLNRVDCSTSLALDGRQGFSLAGMVKPDAVFIDLTMPRGEGLRLVHRLRSHPETAAIAMIFALGEPYDAERFQFDAARVLGDSHLSGQALSEAFASVLGDIRMAEQQRETA